MNSVEITGRLVRDPELRYVGEGFAITTLNVAVDNADGRYDRDAKKSYVESGFYQVEVIGEHGEYVADAVRKGGLVYVRGSLTQFVTKPQEEGKESQRRTRIKAAFVIILSGATASQPIAAPANPVVEEDGWSDKAKEPF